MASTKPSILLLTLLVCMLTTLNAQQPTPDKFGLDKNTQLPISYFYRTVNKMDYQDFLVDLYLGADGKDNTPTQKGSFSIDFNSNSMLITEYSEANPKGFNVTQQLGFDLVSNDAVPVTIRGKKYSSKAYKTWVRSKADQKVSPSFSKSNFNLLTDTAKWAADQPLINGTIGLGSKSEFFQALIQTYKPAQGDVDRIPVSWSLNPVDEATIFDSRASFKADTFILNGQRATEKLYGSTATSINGVWYFPNMAFKLESYWNATSKTVCIDPNADATIAVPSEDYKKIWDAIQSVICDKNQTSSCSFNNDRISKTPKFEISFESPAEFKPQVTLSGSDIIKSVGDNKYSWKGISLNTDVSSICDPNTIVLGRWFFTKAELTFSVSTKDASVLAITLSNIEKMNKPDEKGGIPLLVILLIVFGVIALAIIGFFVWVKRRELYKADSDYLPSMDHDSSAENKTFEGR
jgi:hypothetical protein